MTNKNILQILQQFFLLGNPEHITVGTYTSHWWHHSGHPDKKCANATENVPPYR